MENNQKSNDDFKSSVVKGFGTTVGIAAGGFVVAGIIGFCIAGPVGAAAALKTVAAVGAAAASQNS